MVEDDFVVNLVSKLYLIIIYICPCILQATCLDWKKYGRIFIMFILKIYTGV